MDPSSLPNGPASPETPVNVWLDGGLNAVDLVRRLHRGGLELKSGDDGRTVLVLRTDAPKSTARTRLFEAHAVIEAVRLALSSKSDSVDMETTATDALAVAARMVNSAASDMEGSDHE